MFDNYHFNTYKVNVINQSLEIQQFEFGKELRNDIYIAENPSNCVISLDSIFIIIKEYLEEEFGKNYFKFNCGIRKRWKSVFKQYVNSNIDFRCVFQTTIRLISETKIQISSIMDIIRIYEFVISYLTNIFNTSKNKNLQPTLLNVDDVMYIMFKKEGISEIKTLSFSNLRQAYYDLIVEYKNISTCDVYLFPDQLAAVYHYYKHKKFGGKTLNFFKYLKQATYYIDIVVNNYNNVQIRNSNNRKIPYNIYFKAYEIEYNIIIRNKMGLSSTYVLYIHFYEENSEIKLVFEKRGNAVTIKTFYSMN